MTDILLVGSGHSARLVEKLDLSKFLVIAVNHGWLAVDGKWNHWVRSRDFSIHGGKCPIVRPDQYELKDYDTVLNKFGGEQKCGYSVMLIASYYALSLKPNRIFYVGADMNYRPDDRGNTHIYGVGLDIRKGGVPDPDKMVAKHGKGDPLYLEKIYKRFEIYARTQQVQLFNLSDDPNTRLPYPKFSVDSLSDIK